MPKWKVTVDSDVCVGSGTCVSREPAFFEWDEGGQSQPIAAIVDDDQAVQSAADMCPSEAIRVTMVES